MLSEHLQYGHVSHERIKAFVSWCTSHPSSHGESVLSGLLEHETNLIPVDALTLLVNQHSDVERRILRVEIICGDGWKFTHFFWSKKVPFGSIYYDDWFLESDDAFALQFKLACL